MAQPSTTFPRFKRRSIALFFLRLPVFIPWIFVMRGWMSLNEKDSLTLVEADILGTGGEFCFLVAVSITPLITLTGARWFAPLRRWYGIFFALIGISDATTAAITTNFSGGVFGRLAGHTFLLTGLMIILVATPLLLTANTPAQRRMGTWWKKLQKMTYLIWGIVILHLALLDGFRPFDGPQGDGDPVFHHRFYQILAISLPLVILRLPPVKRWVTEKRQAGEQWKVWVRHRADGRAVPHRVRVHHQRGVLHRPPGHVHAAPVELTRTDGMRGAPPRVVAGLRASPRRWRPHVLWRAIRPMTAHVLAWINDHEPAGGRCVAATAVSQPRPGGAGGRRRDRRADHRP